ncbi:MAG TPA: imidazolonepropionase [Fimbriimonadales bacterium]|nr:imidazolonepropionase [Fimbriimonadales bacterium]
MNVETLIAPIGELHTLAGKPGARKGEEMQNTSVLRNAAMAIGEGIVQEVGDAKELLRKWSSVPRIDAADHLITPGFVDPHTHLVWGGSRAGEFIRRCRGESYQKIAAEGGGILKTMRATREASVEELTQGILRRAELMLRKGTTTLEIKASYGLSEEGVRKELDAIREAKRTLKQRTVVTFMGAHAFPPETTREEYIELLEAKLIPFAAKHRAEPAFNDVFCDEGAFDVRESERILQAGLRYNLRPKIHSDEFKVLGGTELGTRLGAASCDHLLQSGDAQIEALANSDTIAVVLPGTAFYLDKPYANARKMIDKGCAVALGTDFNPGTSMICDMRFVMGLAVAKMKLTPEEALTAATVNAAAALEAAVPKLLGTLTPGAPADFCIWNAGSLEELIYQFALPLSPEVYCAGKKV